MRILIASPYLPWPLGTGGAAAQFSTLQCLAEDHQFTLVCPIFSKLQEKHAEKLAEKLPNVKIRAVFAGPPPEAKALKLLKDAKQIAREWIKGPYSSFEDGSPYYPFSPLAAAYVDAITEELKQGVDLFQAEFSEVLPLVFCVPPSIPKLFINHQIQFVYAQRFMLAHGAKPYSEYLTAWMFAQEQLYLRHFDGVIAFSEQDRTLMAQLPGVQAVYTSPFPIPADVGISTKLPTAFDGRYIFLGSQEHGPNREALMWLLNKIWPLLIAQLPSARLEIVGPWSEGFQKTVRVPSVTFSGFVPDLSAVLQGGTMLVPLRVGSGIRTKILVALAQGVPVVTTPIGVEGLLVRDGEELLVREDAKSFADAAVQLAREPELWMKLAVAGRESVAKHYSREEVRRRRNEIYATLAARSHRRVSDQSSTATI